MHYVIAVSLGVLIAACLIHLARRFEIEQTLFSYALMAGAFWYVLFAVFEDVTLSNWIVHLVAAMVFLILGLLGATRSMIFTAIGWGLHIIWDFSAHHFGEVPGPWWTGPTCLGFDPVIALYIALRVRGSFPFKHSPQPESLP